MRRLLLALLLVTAAAPAAAQEQRQMSDCFEAAGRTYQVSPLLLQAIAWVESRYVYDAVRENTNGSRDIGVMQINSLWLASLETYGIREEHLQDACLNIGVGAWILRQQVNEVGYNWEAVARYHSRTRRLGDAYARRVASVYYRLRSELYPQGN